MGRAPGQHAEGRAPVDPRVKGIGPGTWEDPSLVQVWGRSTACTSSPPRTAVFTLGRLPDDPAKRRAAQQLADGLERALDGRRLDCREAGRGLVRHPGSLRYAAPTGRVLMRWDGARQPTIWTVPAPDVDPAGATRLARRYLHVFGPATADTWNGRASRPPELGRSSAQWPVR